MNCTVNIDIYYINKGVQKLSFTYTSDSIPDLSQVTEYLIQNGLYISYRVLIVLEMNTTWEVTVEN